MAKATLLIMAAGLGSRYGGNKQIDGLGPNGEILMQYSIYDAIRAGFDKIVFVIKPEHRALIEQVCESISGAKIDFAYQDFSSIPEVYRVPEERVKPFGTVHAVLCAKDVIRGPFATVNADDYYGKQAFSMIREMLLEMKGAADAAMIPYILGNTMSENGSVTRGVCEVKDGYLVNVNETHDIAYTEDRRIVGENGELIGDEQVSMNFWGFHPALLCDMQTYFEDFLKGLTPEQIKAECLLPIMVNDFLNAKKVTVRARFSPDRWFGITYREDRETVAEELAKLHKRGAYPEKLF